VNCSKRPQSGRFFLSFTLLPYPVTNAALSEDQQNVAATDTGGTSLNLSLSYKPRWDMVVWILSALIPLLFTSVFFIVVFDEINIIPLR